MYLYKAFLVYNLDQSRPVKVSTVKEKNLLKKSDQYFESTKLSWKSLKTAYILHRQNWFVKTDLTIICYLIVDWIPTSFWVALSKSCSNDMQSKAVAS